jgi:hypothetical protein
VPSAWSLAVREARAHIRRILYFREVQVTQGRGEPSPMLVLERRRHRPLVTAVGCGAPATRSARSSCTARPSLKCSASCRATSPGEERLEHLAPPPGSRARGDEPQRALRHRPRRRPPASPPAQPTPRGSAPSSPRSSPRTSCAMRCARPSVRGRHGAEDAMLDPHRRGPFRGATVSKWCPQPETWPDSSVKSKRRGGDSNPHSDETD